VNRRPFTHSLAFSFWLTELGDLSETRKTAPGLRALDKLAHKLGGGMNHRIGLYDMVMIKVEL